MKLYEFIHELDKANNEIKYIPSKSKARQKINAGGVRFWVKDKWETVKDHHREINKGDIIEVGKRNKIWIALD